MRAPEALIRAIPAGSVVSISGAGGKTTLLFELGHALPGPCVTTTTTKVGTEQITAADARYSLDEWLRQAVEDKCAWVAKVFPQEGRKQSGFDTVEELDELINACRERGVTLLYEADGAARRHIKAPAAHEPVISPLTDVCIYVIGLDTLGEPVSEEYVHRPELFTAVTGRTLGESIQPVDLIALAVHPNGGLKNVPDGAERILYLTHGDNAERRAAAKTIADAVLPYSIRTFIS